MVSDSLCKQHQDRAQENDSIHLADDRRVEESEQEVPQPSAKALPKALAARPKSAQQPDASGSRTRRGDLRHDERSPVDRSTRSQGGHQRAPDQNAQSGERDAAHDRADVAGTCGPAASGDPRSSGDRSIGMGRSLEQLTPEDDASCHWALQAGEIDTFCNSIPNNERQHFWGLVNKIEKELHQMSSTIKPNASNTDVLEVFCSSKLTHQILQLGGQAKRFGRDQGDLMTPEGRRELFAIVLKHRPRHVWVSPACGPWSKWSQFNSQRSVTAWESVSQDRWSMLTQVALCLVLCRHQHGCQRHAHWEQPKGSLMMKLPYLQEIQRYMVVARPDLCNAGNLKTLNQSCQS